MQSVLCRFAPPVTKIYGIALFYSNSASEFYVIFWFYVCLSETVLIFYQIFCILGISFSFEHLSGKHSNAVDPEPRYFRPYTGMRRLTTFRSTTDLINDGGPIILRYYIIIIL